MPPGRNRYLARGERRIVRAFPGAGVRVIAEDGVEHVVLEGFRDLYKVLLKMPLGERWDVIAADKYSIVEIVSLGDRIRLGMVADIDWPWPPPPVEAGDFELTQEAGKLYLKGFFEYRPRDKSVYLRIATRINKFRILLRDILASRPGG